MVVMCSDVVSTTFFCTWKAKCLVFKGVVAGFRGKVA